MTGMVGSGSRVQLATVIRVVRPIGGGVILDRRSRTDRGGVLMAVACVVVAVLLYGVVTLVGGFVDDSDDGSLGAIALVPTWVPNL
jgi:hypothetical protein